MNYFFQSFMSIRTGLCLPFDLSTFKEHDVRTLALYPSLCRGTHSQLVPNTKRVLSVGMKSKWTEAMYMAQVECHIIDGSDK
jgi:hypothetical protein